MVIFTLDGGVVGVVFENSLRDIVGQTKLKKNNIRRVLGFDEF